MEVAMVPWAYAQAAINLYLKQHNGDQVSALVHRSSGFVLPWRMKSSWRHHRMRWPVGETPYTACLTSQVAPNGVSSPTTMALPDQGVDVIARD
jgi:hypothetical protein